MSIVSFIVQSTLIACCKGRRILKLWCCREWEKEAFKYPFKWAALFGIKIIMIVLCKKPPKQTKTNQKPKPTKQNKTKQNPQKTAHHLYHGAFYSRTSNQYCKAFYKRTLFLNPSLTGAGKIKPIFQSPSHRLSILQALSTRREICFFITY